MTKANFKSFGFTIVELLVVIVVIGILAVITSVSYAGINQKAIAISLQSDLNGASKKLKMYQVEYGKYPDGLDGSNCPTNPSDAKYCLKPSSGNAFSYSSTTPFQTYILTSQRVGTTTSYVMTNDSIPTLVTNATATGGTITYLDSESLNPRSSQPYAGGYTVHTFTSGGPFTVSGGTINNASVLVVGGGGGGGSAYGGGGAGQFITLSNQSLSGTVNVVVGAGGAINTNGSLSSFGSNVAIGGGAGAGGTNNGSNGASGGGGGGAGGLGGTGLAGNNGGNGAVYAFCGGGEPAGGGGAGYSGGNGGGCIGGNGGGGLSSTISGTTRWYAGGGSAENTGGQGGGGAGGVAGAANTGGGGGGNAAGGSGIVIVRYLSPDSPSLPSIYAIGGVVTYVDSSGLNPRSYPSYAGGYTIHTFNSSWTLTVYGGTINGASALIVGGGGSGGGNGGGGGGAGGLLSRTGINLSGIMTVTVGTGGAGWYGYTYTQGNPGNSSIFAGFTATGGGYGGGSSAGGGGGNGGGGSAGVNTAGIGSIGFNGGVGGGGKGGGGGGAGGVGGVGSSGGPGGIGVSSSISGVSTFYAGGGGGADAGGTGGSGIGGNGGVGMSGNATSGAVNTGSGGGGCVSGSCGAGGSGVVIVKYQTP